MLYEARHLSKAFGKNIVIRDFNLKVNKGEMIAIVGKKGSGKTTLAQMLGGLLKPSLGELRTTNRVVSSKKGTSGLKKLRRTHISYVSSEPVLINELTIYENLLLADKKNSGTNRSKKAKAKNTLKMVGLIGKGHYMPKELSIAERQKVCIARAIINKPIMLILDEPTAFLDEKGAYSVIEILQKLNQNGMTIVLTTRNRVVASNCTRAVAINKETDISTIVSNRIAPIDIKSSMDNAGSEPDQEAVEGEEIDEEEYVEEEYDEEYSEDYSDEEYDEEYSEDYSDEEYDEDEEYSEDYSGEYDDYDDDEDYNDPEVNDLINQIKSDQQNEETDEKKDFVMPEIDLTNIFNDKK